MLLASVAAMAQDKIYVSGEITSEATDEPLQYVLAYVYNTVAEGKDAYEEAKAMFDSNSEWLPDKDYQTMTDPAGFYEVLVPDDGSIVFYRAPFEPVFISVRGKKKINLQINATEVLDKAEVQAEGKKKTRKDKIVQFGKVVQIQKYYYFDSERMGTVEKLGKTNARLVAQMFVVSADGKDTVQYYKPKIYDGEQFHATQELWSKDTLFNLAGSFDRVRDTLEFRGQFENEHPENIYFAKAHVWIEDYIMTYYADTVEVMNSGRTYKPFQFLEYSFDECLLDPQTYFKEARRENIDEAKNLNLKFKVNSAELDMSDDSTAIYISQLKEELRDICNNPETTLKELHVNGYSSPDGNFASNQPLSDKRTQTVKAELLSVLTSGARARLYQTGKGHVAPWTEVADLLERDSLFTEAADVRAIVEKYPNSIDQQGARMRGLPYYKSKISPRLPELRRVKCEHKVEMYRELKPHEILDRYNKDKAAGNGIKNRTLNEYWHLFNQVKDKAELEFLYQSAVAASIKIEKKPWALPANHLAVAKLRKKQVDTMLLKPFIDDRFTANFRLQDPLNPKLFEIINPDAIVANQVQMFMLAENYERAAEFSTIIENEHPKLRAIVRCLGGYIDFTDPNEAPAIELVKSSSPRNEVIVNLFQFDTENQKLKDTLVVQTVAALQKLPAGEAMTDYLKAQRLCMQYDNQVKRMQAEDFNRDEDPDFRHPKDKEIPLATPEEIEALRQRIIEDEGYRDSDLAIGMVDSANKLTKDIEANKAKLANMEKGEMAIDPYKCSVYEAVYQYLKQCFVKDKKFELTARADSSISEELLNDVLGIKPLK